MKTLRLAALIATVVAPTIGAQDPAVVEVLAPVMMTEDRRVIDPAALVPALEHPDPYVRFTAVRAVGRIKDRAGIPLIAQRLYDRDDLVVTETFFALGLIGEESAVELITDRLRAPDDLSSSALTEAATALARIGGTEAVRLLTDIVGRVGNLPLDRLPALLPAAIVESWRLGKAAPVDQLRRYTRGNDVDLRYRSVWVLGRLQAPEAAEDLLTAMRDRVTEVREAAVKYLWPALVDSAGIGRANVLELLTRAFVDQSSGVRINALNTVGRYGPLEDSTVAERVRVLLTDRDRLVRVAAADALGALGGPLAGRALMATVDNSSADWSLRRSALLGLARNDPDAFRSRVAPWLSSSDRLDRLTGLTGWAELPEGDSRPFRTGISHADPVTRLTALRLWQRSDPTSVELKAAAASAFRDSDPRVRGAALAVLADTASDAALDLIAEAWRSRDRELRSAALTSLIRIARGDRRMIGRLTSGSRRLLLQRPPEPELRALAVRGFPALGARWGGVGAVETGKILQDYRELVARVLLAPVNPRVEIDVENRGKIEIELLPREAPLTVANFLKLLDRGWFNGVPWHRVVPNFVVQDGDPTGSGSGGPGWTIRDEINRLRYTTPMVGMALSGPDTGGSQWFINLSPQPHLNGGYTIFGKVVGSRGTLNRVQMGDVIRTIQRLAGP